MPVSFVDAFDIDHDLFDETGSFNPVLDVDSKLFIDPALLPESSCPEFKGARAEVEHFFSGIIALLRNSSGPGDRFWKRASDLLSFTEIKGTCLGYSERGTSGNAIGRQLREGILRSIKELIDAGARDPIIFELIGVFEEGIGCDRISDLLTYKLVERICHFTEWVLLECHYTGPLVDYKGFNLPKSPFSEGAILLLPRDILHPLPLAKRFEDLESVCRENQRVRENVNEWFDFSEGASPSKSEVYYHLRKDTEFRDAFVDAYRSAKPEKYDYSRDTGGEVAWYEAGKNLAHRNPLPLAVSKLNREGLESVVTAIVNQFKQLVENEGAWELIFQDNRQTPRSERYSQHFFSSVAASYCKANDIDISPEANSGNGPVDFKFSSGYSNKVLVEIKLSKNTHLDQCIDKQIPKYMAQEETDRAVYLLINVGNDKKVAAFHERYDKLSPVVRDKIKLVIVDAKPKQSASRA